MIKKYKMKRNYYLWFNKMLVFLLLVVALTFGAKVLHVLRGEYRRLRGTVPATTAISAPFARRIQLTCCVVYLSFFLLFVREMVEVTKTYYERYVLGFPTIVASDLILFYTATKRSYSAIRTSTVECTMLVVESMGRRKRRSL